MSGQASPAPPASTVTDNRDADAPYFTEFPPCPECERPTDRQHFSVVPGVAGQYVSFLYCGHCDVAYESLWIKYRSGRWQLDSSIRYDGENVARILEILESLLCVTD